MADAPLLALTWWPCYRKILMPSDTALPPAAPLISVVVPVRNEAPNIAPLIAEIRAALAGVAHEIVYVDDGSTDTTPQELGTARALGEVEALEALGIDPIHYLVVPRVIGFAVAVVSLNAYLILMALG